jgi:restriction endonuclease
MAAAPSEQTDPILDELKALVPGSVIELLEQRDSAPKLIDQLPRGLERRDQRAWELAGLHLGIRQRRFYEAILIFEEWYRRLLEYQTEKGVRVHKGAPLVWIRDFHVNLDHTALAKRFIMLTLIEDALSGNGTIDPEKSGVYFRLVWYHGMPDRQLRRYAEEIAAFGREDAAAARYPEQLLQHLDKLWMTEFPTTAESSLYPVNRRYVADLLAQTGDKTGKKLEFLADYLLSAMPGCRTYRRKRSPSTDYDIVCSLDGFDLDFRSELGRYFVCECKDWSAPADFTALAKFARVLDSTKSRFGILFSREGITGRASTSAASREQLKLFQDRGIVIVVVTRDDINSVVDGYNFITLLREKYETVRLDLMPEEE